MSSFARRLACAFVPLLCALGCGGGGGGGGGIPAFTLTVVSPAISADLGGGDVVSVMGTNFLTVGVAGVTFGGVAGTNILVISDTEVQVETPPAPGGAPGAVNVAVTSVSAGTQQILDGYTYSNTGPLPLSIAPTIFTPTGAEDFTITGSDLGPHGGQVTVTFLGIGSVPGTVSANGQSVTGRAAVSAGVPPVGPVIVNVDTGVADANVPVSVSYAYSGPLPVGPVAISGQTITGNASRPVRVADGYAVVCTAGADFAWGTADDDVRMVHGPPNAVMSFSIFRRNAPGTLVGYLSPTNSIPAILGPDTFAIFTPGGPAATPPPGYVLVTAARTAPIADIFAHPGINATPLAAIGTNRVAFMGAGVDGVFGPPPANLGDDLWVVDFNIVANPPVPVFTARIPLAGIADVAAGPFNFTIPFSADGDTVVVMGCGGDAAPSTGDDTFLSHTVSTVTTSTLRPAPFLIGRPIPISPTLFAGPGAGVNGTFGNGDDTLESFTYAAATWTRTPYLLGTGINLLAVSSHVRVGNGIAVAVMGGSPIKVYTAPAVGTNTSFPFSGTPLMGTLGNGGLVVFGPGINLVPGTGGDDVALHIDAGATSPLSFSLIPNLLQAIPALFDADRAFSISPGPDGIFETADDTLEVYQSRSLAAPRSASQLPVSALPAARVMANIPLVPIGPGWGLIQSPGTNRTFGDADDQLILARY